MSKSTLIIFLLCFFITTIYCQEYCTSKFAYNYDDPYSNTYTFQDESTAPVRTFTNGYTRTVWHHENSCNTFLNPDNRYCCYIHIEYKSNVDGERYDKYGCIDVDTPFEDYGGNITMVENRVEDVKSHLSEIKMDEGFSDYYVIDNTTNFHVKIVCSANFIKSSLFTLLLLILF